MSVVNDLIKSATHCQWLGMWQLIINSTSLYVTTMLHPSGCGLQCWHPGGIMRSRLTASGSSMHLTRHLPPIVGFRCSSCIDQSAVPPLFVCIYIQYIYMWVCVCCHSSPLFVTFSLLALPLAAEFFVNDSSHTLTAPAVCSTNPLPLTDSDYIYPCALLDL